MQRRASAFTGYTIEASDGKVGIISDVLFEDQNWKLRWFVINTGSWLMGRKILIHPAALDRPDVMLRAFPVGLTMSQVEESPDLRSDQPVTRQMDRDLSAYYGYSSMLGDSYYDDPGFSLFGDNASVVGPEPPRASSGADEHQLLSVAEITGFQIHALDGDIGHLDDFLVDDESWTIEFAIVATSNWGFGRHVLISPADIRETNFALRYVPVCLTRYKIKSAQSWQEPNWADHP